MSHSLNSHSLRPFNGLQPQLGARVFVDRSAVVIGDVEIGDDSSIWPNTTVRGDMHRIRIGARTSIQDNSVCHITHAGPFNSDGWPLVIGDDCTIGHGVVVHGCTIGNRVLIGIGSIVMDGAIIDDDVVVGANSLVPPGKHLASGYLYTGSPARQVRPLSEREKQYFVYSASNYCRLKDAYLADGS
ncbi:MAG TPA: gamma carbonic anhydrase family protein [Pseudomonadales bacterium]